MIILPKYRRSFLCCKSWNSGRNFSLHDCYTARSESWLLSADEERKINVFDIILEEGPRNEFH